MALHIVEYRHGHGARRVHAGSNGPARPAGHDFVRIRDGAIMRTHAPRRCNAYAQHACVLLFCLFSHALHKHRDAFKHRFATTGGIGWHRLAQAQCWRRARFAVAHKACRNLRTAHIN